MSNTNKNRTMCLENLKCKSVFSWQILRKKIIHKRIDHGINLNHTELLPALVCLILEKLLQSI